MHNYDYEVEKYVVRFIKFADKPDEICEMSFDEIERAFEFALDLMLRGYDVVEVRQINLIVGWH